MKETGKSLEELAQAFPQKYTSPAFRIPCSAGTAKKIVACAQSTFGKRDDVQLITVDGVRAHMDCGWGILRSSNTEPVLCFRVESGTREGLKKVTKTFYTIMQQFLDGQFLKEHLNL